MTLKEARALMDAKVRRAAKESIMHAYADASRILDSVTSDVPTLVKQDTETGDCIAKWIHDGAERRLAGTDSSIRVAMVEVDRSDHRLYHVKLKAKPSPPATSMLPMRKQS